MLEGQRGVKKFVAAIEVYLECIVDEEKMARAAIEVISARTNSSAKTCLTRNTMLQSMKWRDLPPSSTVEVQAYKAKESS